MITLSDTLSWLNHFNISRLKPLTSSNVTKLMDPSMGEQTFANVKLSALQSVSNLDPLELPEVLLHCAAAEYKRQQVDNARESVRHALEHYPNTPANRHRRAVSLWILGILEYQALENNYAYYCWQTALSIFQALAGENVKRRKPQQARWYYERVHEMNLDMAQTAEEAYTWLNIFPPTSAGEIRSLSSKLTSSGSSGATLRGGDIDPNLRNLVPRPTPPQPARRILEKVIERVREHRFASAHELMGKLQELGNLGGNTVEKPEIWLECGLAAHQMDMQVEAYELIKRAGFMYGQDSHQQAVANWMMGVILWHMPGREEEALTCWQSTIRIFGGLMERADHLNRKERWEWYHQMIEILQLAVDQRAAEI